MTLRLWLDDLNPAVRSVGAAVLCAALAQWSPSRQSELSSETLAWLLMPAIFKITKQTREDETLTKSPSSYSTADLPSSSLLWLIAASVATSSVCRAENSVGGALAALIPFLLLSQTSSDSYLFTWNTTWGTVTTTVFAILTLANWNLRDTALSVPPAVVLGGLYVLLSRRHVEILRLDQLANLQEVAGLLSWRIVSILTVSVSVQAIVFGIPECRLLPWLCSGIAKACAWYFVIRTLRHATSYVVIDIVTFGVTSTLSPSIQTSEVRALSYVVASLGALGQTITVIPKQVKSRSILWLLGLVPLTPYLINVWAIRSASSSAQQFSNVHEHPVEKLVRQANVDFEDLVRRQSKTYKAACREYRRRYAVEPPPGFEAWYEFAKAHDSPIIDDFDIIHDAVSPFWTLSGEEVLYVMEDARETSGSEVWLCDFDGTSAEIDCSHSSRSYDRHIGMLFEKLMENVPGPIPDVKFLVNHLDEPRVMIPPFRNEEDVHSRTTSNLTNLSNQPVWSQVTRHCDSRQSKKHSSNHGSSETYGLPFVTSPHHSMDLCNHPEYHAMHGLVVSPTSFRLIEGLVPVLTPGSLSTMGDILFPSPAYIESEFKYNIENDLEWDQKRNNLYWAGSTTGGRAVNGDWHNFHRQRFVTLAQDLESQEHSYLRDVDGVAQVAKSTFLNGRLFDVAFARIFQCQTKYYREQSTFFDVKRWAPKDDALRSRLAFDLDGNGISGRYYKLLASKSTPLKQTLLREWHDERLVPWVHYVPVSQSMEELPELVNYLTLTKSGQQRAKDIAEQGREWLSKAFREVDLSIYTYRLLLELARLQDPERKAS